MQIAMVQDKIVPFETLDPIYFDRGIYFGDGVYEVLRSYKGRIFALGEHMQRFANSLAAIEINSIDIDQIRSRVKKAFEAADISEAKIYFHVTRGSAPRNHVSKIALEPNFFLTVTELADDTKEKTEGIAVSTHPDWRWKRCDIKSLNLLANVLARQDAAKKDCEEAILVDENGLITEGAASAFFAIFNDQLRTAPLTANILPSVTRRYILKAAESIGLKVIEKSVKPDEAKQADELFIAVTTKDVIGVVKFDNKPIGNSLPGKHTKLLTKKFHSYTL